MRRPSLLILALLLLLSACSFFQSQEKYVTETFSCGNTPFSYNESAGPTLSSGTVTQFTQGQISTCSNSTYLYIIQGYSRVNTSGGNGVIESLSMNTPSTSVEFVPLIPDSTRSRIIQHWEASAGIAGTVTIRGNVTAGTPNTEANITEGKAIAIEIDNSSVQNFNNTCCTNNVSSVDGVYDGSTQDSVNVTIQVVSAGEYLILAHAMVKEANASSRSAARLYVNSSIILPHNTTDAYSYVAIKTALSGKSSLVNIVSVQNLSAGTYVLSFQHADVDNTPSNSFRNASIMAIRLSPFLKYYYNQSTSEQQVSSASFNVTRRLSIPARGSINRTFLIIVNDYKNVSSTLPTIASNVTIDGTVQGAVERSAVADVNDWEPFTKFYLVSLNSSNHTVESSSKTEGSGTSLVKEALILAIELNASPSIPTVVSSGPIELGTLFNVSVDVDSPTCLDSDASNGGLNLTCSNSSFSYEFNITSFVKRVFNDSSSVKNLSYNLSGGSNLTAYVAANSHDDVVNLTLYLNGFSTNGSFPTGVKLFVNNTLANSIGLILNTTIFSLTSFNDSSVNITYNFTSPSTNIVGYLHIPKNANVTGSNLSFSGGLGYTLQENANSSSIISVGAWVFNYTKPATASNNSVWEAKHGIAPTVYNATLPSACWNANNTWVAVMLNGQRGVDPGGNHTSYGACWNSTAWQIVSIDTIVVPGDCTTCTFTSRASSVAYDGDWNTQVFYSYYSAGYRYTTGAYSVRHANVYEEAMQWEQRPNDPWMEVGTITGARDWNYTGALNTTSKAGNFSAKINTFLQNCVADADGYCDVPVYVYSNGGSLNIFNLTINYTYVINPIYVNVNSVQSFLNHSSGRVNIPLTFQNDKNGTIQISNVTYIYVGGNSTVSITAHSYDGLLTNTTNFTLVASQWNYSLPRNIVHLEFIPSTPNSKNVGAYGQTNTTPFLNITNDGYDWNSFNFSVFVNETHSCVNLSIGNTSNASLARQSNNTWTYLLNNMTVNKTGGIWLFANYSCNTSAWRLWRPRISFRACGFNTTCSDSVT